MKYLVPILIASAISNAAYSNETKSCRSFVGIEKIKIFKKYDRSDTGDVLVNLYDVNPIVGPHYQSHKDLHKGDEFLISTKTIIYGDKSNQWVSVNSGFHEAFETDNYIYLAAGAIDTDATWFSIDDPILYGSDESHHHSYSLLTLNWQYKGFGETKKIKGSKVHKYKSTVEYKASTMDIKIGIYRFCQKKM